MAIEVDIVIDDAPNKSDDAELYGTTDEVEVDKMILRESEAVTLFNSVAVVVPDGTSSLVAEVLLDVRIEWSSHVFWGKKSAICLWRFMTLRFSGF